MTISHSAVAAKRYNDSNNLKFFEDKGLFSEVFSQYLGREVMDLRQSSLQDFIDFTKRHSHFLAKEYDQLAGEGIDYIRSNEIKNFKNLYKRLLQNRQYIFEEFINQDKEMSKLSLHSVNTIQMITFIDDKNVPHLLVSALKCGKEGIIDNIGQGGMYTILDDDGRVMYPMVDQSGHSYRKHPITGTDFMSFKVPRYPEMVEMSLEASMKIPQVRYVGWDVALSVDGPLIIEGNLQSGVFQPIPSVSQDNRGYRPLFEHYMGDLSK